MDTATKEPATIGDLVDALPEPIKPGPIVHLPAVTPMQLLQGAIERGATVEQLSGLLALQERWEATQARKAYVQAMTEFKADPPTIIKNKGASFDKGKTTAYEYADLANVVTVIAASLSKHGFSHRWRHSQSDGKITVACILTHVMGHSEETELTGPADTSGSKNGIQAVGSTSSYLERYTLLGITGLAAKGQDDDARSLGVGDTISAEQKEKLVGLMRDAEALLKDPQKFRARFNERFKIAALDDLMASQFKDAQGALVETINANKKPDAA